MKPMYSDRTNRIWRVLNAVTAKNFTKVFSTVNYCIGLAERERIVGVGQLGLD